MAGFEPQTTKKLGNASKRLDDMPPAPWFAWSEPSRSAERAIRWIERYCVLPKGYGSGKPIQLAPFQRAWLEEVLDDGVSSAVMGVGRGNGKSTFLAAVALWALFDPDPAAGAPQVPIVATTVSQAIRSVYGVAVAMIKAAPELEGRAKIFSGMGTMRVAVPHPDGFTGEMFPVSNDPDGLQGLDPSLVVCDEVGFQPIESWDSLLLAGGKRPRSLVVGIGTPGFDRDNALWHLRSRVMDGGAPPGFVFTEYAADPDCDVKDESQWAKANPALAEGYMNIDALRTALALSPEAHFRIFRLGQWVDGVECWLGSDGRKVWDSLRDPYEPVRGAPTWVGVDVALKHDSTAVAAIQRRPDGRLHVWSKIWLPTKDHEVDVTDVMQYIRELAADYKIEAVSYDPKFFDVPAKQLVDNDRLPMVEIPQSIARMTQAVGSTYELIVRGGVSHDGEPTFTAQVLNAVARFNESGFTLQKQKSRGKIDAAVAMCLAVDRALRVEPAKKVRVVSMAAVLEAASREG